MGRSVFLSIVGAILLMSPGIIAQSSDDYTWTSWLEWTDCSVTCGDGYHVRSRTCQGNDATVNVSSSDCPGDDYEVKDCQLAYCPVDGEWGSWLAWIPCSLTCGQGVRSRFRNCDNPAPAYNGTDCMGKKQEFDPCLIAECPIDGMWTTWEEWTLCSSSCENGTRIRQRQCSNPAPAHGGNNCTGEDIQLDSCFVSVVCPINGNWTAWTNWSPCDKTCGTGLRVRLRECTNPPPKYNGLDCAGSPTEAENCSTNNCPIDGHWTDWFEWSKCSVSCGTGTQNRIRLCTNPKPEYGGTYCAGDFEELRNCTNDPLTNACALDGGWAMWDGWSGCSATCGTGLQNRNRTCTNPAPLNGGKTCPGSSIQTGNCTTATSCPVDGGWSSWREWFSCSVTCGDGTRDRVRTCTEPKPQFGGVYCMGDSVETDSCSGPSCGDTNGTVALVG